MNQIRKDYQQYITNLQIKGSIVGCILSMLLVPIGVSADYLLYGEFFTQFLYARLSCTALTAVILLLHFHKTIHKFIKILTFSWISLVQILVCSMIILSGKSDLSYYYGLILVIFAATILLPLSAKETILICAISITTYTITVLQTSPQNFGVIYNNIFSLTLASIIGITATILKMRLLFEHFLLNYKLQNKIKQRQKMHQQLIEKETTQATDNLSSELIHEINNPLNFTITALNSLHNLAKDNPELQDLTDDISTGTLRIKSTIENLKNLSLLQKPIEKTNFNIIEAVQTASKLREETLGKINLELCINKDLSINASKIHLIQIFINLIGNSIHSLNILNPKDPKITITATQENDQTTFTISDNGQRIEDFEITDINSDSIIQNKNNKRLDLNIAIRLIIQHNSKINIEAQQGLNSISFIIRSP